MQFEVELAPFIGQAGGTLGMYPVQHAADVVRVKGKEVADWSGLPFVEVGYAGHQSGTVDFLPVVRELGRGAAEVICREVARLTGRDRTPTIPANPVVAAAAASVPDLDRPQDTGLDLPDLDDAA